MLEDVGCLFKKGSLSLLHCCNLLHPKILAKSA